MISCQVSEIIQSSFFTEHHQVATSDTNKEGNYFGV